MINVEHIVPEVYSKESRDFQLFERTYNLLFNYIKTNVDLMENFPINNNTDSRLIELLCRTLGFENKVNYRNDDLNSLCSIFIDIIKNKGTLGAIKTLVRTILNIEGIKATNINEPKYRIVPDEEIIVNNTRLKTVGIYISEIASNPELKLLEDVLDYIMPAGMLYNIYNTSVINDEEIHYLIVDESYKINSISVSSNTKLYMSDNLTDDSALRNKKMDLTLIATSSPAPLSPEEPLIGDFRYSRLSDSFINKEGK